MFNVHTQMLLSLYVYIYRTLLYGVGNGGQNGQFAIRIKIFGGDLTFGDAVSNQIPQKCSNG